MEKELEKIIKKSILMEMVQKAITADHNLHVRLIDMAKQGTPIEIANHFTSEVIDTILDEASETIDSIL